MADIDLTLNNFMIGNMPSFQNIFGTKKTEETKGCSTAENTVNMMLPFLRMRPIIIAENSVTGPVEADASLRLTGAAQSLALGAAAYKGCEIKVANETETGVTIQDGAHIISIEQGDTVDLRWNGSEWRVKTDYHVGDFLEQYPDMTDPVTARLEGTWEIWSDRAIIYGLSAAPAPDHVDYYSLVGQTLAAGSQQVVLYHLAGSDYQLYKIKSGALPYVVAPELDPIKWDLVEPATRVERRKCGNKLTAPDLVIGDQLSSGSFAGMYVTEIIVTGGKFPSIEGGFRPTFISGGVQRDRIRDITGSVNGIASSSNWPTRTDQITGAFKPDSAHYTTTVFRGDSSGWIWSPLDFAASRVVPTGPDVAPINLSIRVWRRVA
jgi:hypothetical protein